MFLRSGAALVFFLTAAIWAPTASGQDEKAKDSKGAKAAGKRFDPEAHFPPQPLACLSVKSLSRLEKRLGETLIGTIVSHPGWKAAFAGLARTLREKMEEGWKPFVAITGKTPLEILSLFEGEVAFTLKGFGPQGLPEAALAIELGDGADEILKVLNRLKSAYEQGTQMKLEVQVIKGFEATIWPTPAGAALHSILGTHLVIATSPDVFDSIAGAFAGEGQGRWLSPEMEKELAVTDREVLFFADLAALRAIVSGFLAATPQANDIETVFRVSGLDSLTSLGYALGFRDGGMEGAFHLATQKGTHDALEVLRSGFPPIADGTEALSLIPARALELQVMRIAPGKALGDLDRLVRESVPEAPETLDSVYQELEENVGISMKRDVFSLGDITIHTFSADPPAGGLFPDQLALVKSEAFAGYLKLLLKLGKALGVEARTLESTAGKVESLNLASAPKVREVLGDLFRRGPLDRPPPELILPVILSAFSFSKADLPGGWTVVSPMPQAVLRHLEHYSKGPKLSESSEVTELAQKEISGASFGGISRNAKSLLSTYNTLLTLACAFSPFLSQAGIDPTSLPPAEAFLSKVHPGFYRLTMGPSGFSLHGHRALESSSSGVLVGVAAGSMAAGFLVPTLLKGRGEAQGVMCMNNLKQLYGFAMPYSDKSGTRAFPYSPKGSLASLQVLIDFEPQGMQPGFFVCPNAGNEPPAVDGERVVLTEDTCSYEVVPWRLKNTTMNVMFMYDKTPCHRGSRNVLFTDGSVQRMDEQTFQARLAKERERFSREPARPVIKKKAKPAEEK